MKAPFKVRLLLLLLSVCFFATALSLRIKTTKEEILAYDASRLERNLHIKEQFINDFLTQTSNIQKLKEVADSESYALKIIDDFTKARNIRVQTYHKGELRYWSSVKMLQNSPSGYREGSNFLRVNNGWNEIIKKTVGDDCFLFSIIVKNEFPYQNQYLKNDFLPDILSNANVDIAKFTDREVYNIYNIHHKYLFSIKLKPTLSRNIFITIEIWMWFLGLASLCIFVNSICVWIAGKGAPVLGSLLLLTFFVVARWTDLEYRWLASNFDLQIFDPKIYGSGHFLPSYGDLLLNIVAGTWVIAFVYNYRYRFSWGKHFVEKKWVGILVYVSFLFFLAWMAYEVDSVFSGLIQDSRINFDVTNIINLDIMGWLGIVFLCFVWLNLYMSIDIMLAITAKLNLSIKERLLIFVAGFTLVFFYYLLLDEFTVFFIVYALILVLRGIEFFKPNSEYKLSMLLLIIICCAVNSSIKYTTYKKTKERDERHVLATRLENAEDPSATSSLFGLDTLIMKDRFLINYFKQPLGNHNILQNRIQKLYLDGYLSRFDFAMYEYDATDNIIKGEEPAALSKFKSLVESGSIKVTRYFYRLNNTFGFQNYFGLLPMYDDDDIFIGTLVIELKSKPLSNTTAFPELLVDGKIKINDDIKNYSVAYYNDGKLLNQNGKYVYNLTNHEFQGKYNEYIFSDKNGYNHLTYMPNYRKLIIVSKERDSFFMKKLASLSFFFLVFVVFTLLVYAISWVSITLKNFHFKLPSFNRNMAISLNKVLYRTRIQASMVLAVVLTLIIIGWITYLSISGQYRDQQETSIREKVRKVAAGFEKQVFKNSNSLVTGQTLLDFNTYADVNSVDLNLYDTQGNLFISDEGSQPLTTLPKLYSYGLISTYMNARAFIHLSKLQQSEYLNKEESIGDLSFVSAYAPIRNSQYETIAYIGLPYFSNETDYKQKMGQFINTLTNIYALVFVVIGFLAIFIANRITNPLTLIQQTLRRTKIGQPNEPIVWKRNDEIGNLIKEYNYMIEALEDSARKLARSERETAWREMAKQVAHEIKNPLTPLKLGVQLLEKSWKEKDPNFEKKFERFSKSFIEQIESLSRIASEFSNFAKMPETILERVDLLPVIEKAVEVFNQNTHVEITVVNLFVNNPPAVMGDKDQLLRSFNNLLKNATEARTASKKCKINIRLIKEGYMVRIEVEDNGGGIPDHLHSRIFVPNFTTKTSGTGLGLAFVKQAVENAGGSIRFDTELGKGTTFFITMPLA